MDEPLMQAVTEAAAKRKFLKIQYRTDLNEFLTVTSMIKKVEEKGGVHYLELVTGQEIPFDQLVKVGDVASSNFSSRDFTCDC
ncbi:hypothetical protein ACD591_14640 [Rufibacter glacialis]|uniref:Uncharacterized protein n=1 Tax=Rufibacter glacialis TaxID=1259555 RepID=A0A5M8QNZ7_9BACT|nr:hypothetical protein [Rufibacter glacialis]KAA6437799.1 hypothetical protein FOE74_04685 [Rufibacter glacialis]GGK56137.1 hypothetical protein GCM10011405_00360 [Rufibacter glacialis]